jgi:hypothetical protein
MSNPESVRVVRQTFPASMMHKSSAPSAVAAMLAPHIHEALVDYYPARTDEVLVASVSFFYARMDEAA